MLDQEFIKLLEQIKSRKCESKILEIKSANKECPERLYDTFSSFSNQDEGGVIIFGIDERQNFKSVGVYDAHDLQKKLMEIGETMTPQVRPILSVFDIAGQIFVTAEIPPVDLVDRPCFKTAKGRLKGSYIRVGDADKPMNEYEIYSYESFRKKTHDDVRSAEGFSIESLNQTALEQYLLKRKLDRPNFAELTQSQMYELNGITRNGDITLSAALLFGIYPQAYYPQLCIIASRVSGTSMGALNDLGQRFSDSKRIEGTIPEMLDGALRFVRQNMQTALKIDPKTGVRTDMPEYPMDAVREAILNALVHRDYSAHTENMPIQLIMYADRLEIRNPGGLYGRLTVEQLGEIQPDTRNPRLVTIMEALGKTENRYSGIPRIRQAMSELSLPKPVFKDIRGEFYVCLYNNQGKTLQKNTASPVEISAKFKDEKNLMNFCSIPRTRSEIAAYFNISSVQYAMKRYLEPLIRQNAILMSIPQHPRSPHQTYQTNPIFLYKQ